MVGQHSCLMTRLSPGSTRSGFCHSSTRYLIHYILLQIPYQRQHTKEQSSSRFLIGGSPGWDMKQLNFLLYLCSGQILCPCHLHTLFGHQLAAPHLKLRRQQCKLGCWQADIELAGSEDTGQVTLLGLAKYLAVLASLEHFST